MFSGDAGTAPAAPGGHAGDTREGVEAGAFGASLGALLAALLGSGRAPPSGRKRAPVDVDIGHPALHDVHAFGQFIEGSSTFALWLPLSSREKARTLQRLRSNLMECQERAEIITAWRESLHVLRQDSVPEPRVPNPFSKPALQAAIRGRVPNGNMKQKHLRAATKWWFSRVRRGG